MKIVNKAKRLAKKLDMDFSENRPNNGYGGYNDVSTKVFFNTDNDKAFIVTTCSNCGDGTYVDATNLL
jgi:transcription initiation factor IIE alpha subunit